MGQLNTATVEPSGVLKTPAPLRWWQRFYVRLAALFLVLLFGLGIVLAMLSVGATEEVMVAADQELHRDLALELAPRFEPHLLHGVDEEAINGIIAGLTQINRRVDVYLLEADGEIKSWFMDGRAEPVLTHVSIGPLLSFDGTAVEVEDLAGDGETEAGSLPARPGAAGISARESVENRFKSLGRDTITCITHLYAHALSVELRPYLNSASLRSVAQGVVKQVGQYPLHEPDVGTDERQPALRQYSSKSHALLLRRSFVLHHHILHEFGNGERLEVWFNLPGV